ncbi:MAG: SDR family NAD(P)-dependent oxidoreductase [Candidatus Latescibacterota bacterium]
MSLSGKRVLITGAGGFIGSHLTEELVTSGAKVNAFVKYNSRSDWGLLEELPKEVRAEVDITAGDLKDADAVRRACKDKQIVFHLGALIAIPYSYLNPRDHIETNVIGTLNIMTGCRDAGVERVVHTSTSEVYGTARYTPIDEEHPLQGQSPYSASKIGADKIAESFHLSYELPVSTVRPFNTYGPRQSARAVIPTIISQALTGPEVRLGSLTPERDLLFVKDTVRGFMMAADNEATIGEAVNLGSGKKISIGDLADKIIALIGKSCKIVQEDSRVRPGASEVMVLMANTAKAKRILGWEPLNDLDDGLAATIDYVRSNLSKFKTEIYNI